MPVTLYRPDQDQDLFPNRLVFMEGGVPESFSPDEAGEGTGGVSEEAAERAAEEIRKSAKAAKKQRKEEKKVKKREVQLADLIKAFIHGAKRDDKMALLLSRLLQRNTPPSVLLAIMSLVHPEVIESLENYLEEETDVLPDDRPMEAAGADSNALVQYGKELSQALQVWTRRIFTHASFRPMKTILALAHHHGVNHDVVQLSSVMIQEFFRASSQEIEVENIKQFAELFWRDALKRLHAMANERGLLPNPTQDPMGDDEDDDDDDDE